MTSPTEGGETRFPAALIGGRCRVRACVPFRDVHVYDTVVVAHDFLTIDAKLDEPLDWKRGLSTEVLNGSTNVNPADFGDLGRRMATTPLATSCWGLTTSGPWIRIEFDSGPSGVGRWVRRTKLAG